MTLSDVISKRTVFGKDAVLTNQLTAKTAIVTDNSSSDAVRITQTGSGNALVVEDSTNPDSTPFIVKSDGKVGVGTTTPACKLNVSDSGDAELRITSTTSEGPMLTLDRPIGFSYKIQSDLGQLKILHGTPGVANATTLDMQLNPGVFLTLFGVDVGIGGTASSKLHVSGDVTVSSATTATTATAGTSGAIPTQVAGYLVVSINGTSRKIPYYAT